MQNFPPTEREQEQEIAQLRTYIPISSRSPSSRTMEAGPIFPLISVQSPSGGLAIRIGCPTSGQPARLPPFSDALQTFPLRFGQLIFPIRAHQQSE